MNNHTVDSGFSKQDLLSKVSRYEALFELAGVINAATDIESVGEVLTHRLKFIADVYSWRYICIDGEPEDAEEPQSQAIVIDGYRGRVDVTRTVSAALSDFELRLWRDRKTSLLFGKPMEDALEQIPIHLQKDDLEQISVNALVENGKTRALYLFCKRRYPFTTSILSVYRWYAVFSTVKCIRFGNSRSFGISRWLTWSRKLCCGRVSGWRRWVS